MLFCLHQSLSGIQRSPRSSDRRYQQNAGAKSLLFSRAQPTHRVAAPSFPTIAPLRETPSPPTQLPSERSHGSSTGRRVAYPRKIPQVSQGPAAGSVGRDPDIVRPPTRPALQTARTSLLTLLARLFKRAQISGAEPCAVATAHILLQVVAKAKYNDAEQLLEQVQKIGKRLAEAQPKELVVGNIVRRVLGLIRDEAVEDRNEGTPSGASTPTTSGPAAVLPAQLPLSRRISGFFPTAIPAPIARPPMLPSFSRTFSAPRSLLHMLAPLSPAESGDLSGASTPQRQVQLAKIGALRSEVIDGIEEIKDEIGVVDEQIAAAAEGQIQQGDHVLVYQPTRTVTKFLLKAAAKRKFTAYVVGDARPIEGEDRFNSFREKLASSGVTVHNTTSNGMLEHMPRVHKVIISARSVLANGGAMVSTGAADAARSAKGHGASVIILTGVYRISPEDPADKSFLTEWGGPSTSISFADGKMVAAVGVRTAVTEYIPPELIKTYITNV